MVKLIVRIPTAADETFHIPAHPTLGGWGEGSVQLSVNRVRTPIPGSEPRIQPEFWELQSPNVPSKGVATSPESKLWKLLTEY